MYEELINSLRYCATHSCMGEAPALTGCTAIYDDAPKDCDSCNAVLQWQAADAIEELETACDQYEKNYKNICEYLPKWVPVTEKLPKYGTTVLVYRYSDRSQSWRVTTSTLLSYGDWTLSNVTHWMPLPTPPAVDTEEQP